jgi:hypothetical protein
LDPGVNMSYGQEPSILSDLRKLSSELGKMVYVISGYRSPAHSVAVGGFADDPHTRGQAADIGVGSPTLGSMFGVPEKALRAVGLYRPFYPPNQAEANHVQLLAGGASGSAVGAFGGAGGALARAVSQIRSPRVRGGGVIGQIAQGVLSHATAGANRYLNAHAGGGGVGSFTGHLSGAVPHQVAQFMRAEGFNRIAIAGMLGNAMQESSMNPSTAGGGLWQQISNFGAGSGGSLLNQMRTMLPQIVGLRGSMNSATSPGAAAQIFEQGFERAGIPAMSNRIKYANEAYASGYAMGGRTPAWGGWHANGVDMTVNRPTVFGAGERGSEHVKITPGGKGGHTVNIAKGAVQINATGGSQQRTQAYVERRLEQFAEEVAREIESGAEENEMQVIS